MAGIGSATEYNQFASSGEPPSYSETTDHEGEGHRRISIDSGSDESSVNEEYEVSSISSSIEDQLT